MWLNDLVYLALGKLLIFFGMEFPLPTFLVESRIFKTFHLERLFSCDLCFGFWTYSFVSFATGWTLLPELGFIHYPFVTWIITGALASFLMHIFSIGWRVKFEPTLEL
jgi:hypothetical protein